MALISTCYSCLAFIVVALSLLSIKAQKNHTEYSTRANTHKWNSSEVYTKGNWSLSTARTELSSTPLSSDNSSHQPFMGSKESAMTAETKRVPFRSNPSTTTNGFELSSSPTTKAQQRTSTSNDKSSAVNFNNCEETHRGTLLICVIIIAILVLLCTFLLISTVVLANQVSNMKNAVQSKRQTRNNGDFLTISSSLWPDGADKWNKSSQLLTEANQSMEDLTFEGVATTKGEINKNGTTEKIKETSERSKEEHQTETTISPGAHKDSIGEILSEDVKCNLTVDV